MSGNLMCPAEFVPAPGTMMMPSDFTGIPWMEAALGEIGVEEIKGSRHNGRIVEYFTAVRGNIHDDETAWCSAFANWVMREVGIEGTQRANARSWLSWGTPLPDVSPVFGAVTMLWRGSPGGWQGHVAFFVGAERGSLLLLGGNQDDGVRISPYPQARLLGFRWPPGFPAPNISLEY